MQAISVAQKLNWAGWFTGIMGAFISGGAGSISAALGTMMVDPGDFNFSTGLHKLLLVMLISFLIPGLTSMFKYLQLKPVPDAETPAQP